MKKKDKKEEAQDEIKHKVIHSFYSNSMGSGFSSDDLYIDFVQLPPEDGENWASTTRIFLTPRNFKELIKFLSERLEDYEKEYGEINIEEAKK